MQNGTFLEDDIFIFPFSLVEAKARLGFKAQAISCKVAGDPAGAGAGSACTKDLVQ